jgi:hypothetical protein
MPGRTTWLIASPISAWRRRIRKFPGKRAGDRREDTDQDRRQRELDEFGPHLCPSHRDGRADPAVEFSDLVGGEDILDRGQPVIAPGQARILVDLPRDVPAAFVARDLGRLAARPASVGTPSGRTSPSRRSRRRV